MPQMNDAEAKTQSRCKRSHNRREIMSSRSQKAIHLVGTVVLVSLIGSVETRAQEAGAGATYKDIEATLGIVPGFFKTFPESGIAGAWAEFKGFQLNPATKLSIKTKELIGLAVAAQIPCAYCVYFHTAVARANGATDDEIREAVAMASITRHWSTVLNGMQIDLATFKRDTDTVLKLSGEKAKNNRGNPNARP
jgi:AhpD family alkylhydroperoxidase